MQVLVPYGSDYGEDKWDGGGAHASQGAEIHDSAEEVGDGCDGQDLEAGFDSGVFGVDGEDRGAAEVSSAAEDASNDRREDQAVDRDFVHSFVFSAVVLVKFEAHACLGYGVDGYVEEAEDVVGCRVSCHGYGTEGVYREDCSRAFEVNDCALDTCRDAYLEDLHQVGFFHGQFGESQLVTSL